MLSIFSCVVCHPHIFGEGFVSIFFPLKNEYFFTLEFWEFFIMMARSHLSDKWLINIFPQFIARFFIFLIVPCAEQKLLNLMVRFIKIIYIHIYTYTCIYNVSGFWYHVWEILIFYIALSHENFLLWEILILCIALSHENFLLKYL